MGEVRGRRDINDALAKVHSEKVDERLTGLVGLRKIISENRQSSQLKKLKDDNYHVILEAVFRIAKLESSNYARATKNTKTKVESRLSACAGVVRITVEVALQKLRHKTVKAVVEHIIQTLPTADDGYCEPLLNDYLKALATLLGYKAHPEHFLGNEWFDVVDFCIEAIRDLIKPTESNVFTQSNGTRGLHSSVTNHNHLSRSATPSSGGEFGRKSNNSVLQRASGHPCLRESDRELVLCLQHLTAVTNAPILDRSRVVLSTLIQLLQTYPKVSKIQQPALECINTIMPRVVANDIELALEVTKPMISLIRRSWEMKETPLKEAFLVFLSYGEVLLPRMISTDEDGDCKAALAALVEVLREDYCARRHREQLQLEDLTLYDPATCALRRRPLSTMTFEVRLGNFKAEHPWCLISISAAVMVSLEVDMAAHERATELEFSEPNPKRQRLAHPLDDLFRLTQKARVSERLYALQMLAFVNDALELGERALQDQLEKVLLCLSDDDASIASWAMLVMTSAAGQNAAQEKGLKVLWLQVWRLVARHITSTSTCRAACQLMTVLLDYGLVVYTSIADIVEGMTKSIDLNGPAECDEASTTLWTIILVLRGQENISSAFEFHNYVLRWLFSRWSSAKMRDRHHAIHLNQHRLTFSILRLVCTCLGLSPPHISQQSGLNLGQLAQARLKCLRDQELMKYLLLTKERPSRGFRQSSTSKLDSSGTKLAQTRYQILAGSVVDYFNSEGTALLRDCFLSPVESRSTGNMETIRISIAYSIIAYALLSSSRLGGVHQSSQLSSTLGQLRTVLREHVLHHYERREMSKALFDAFGSSLESVEQVAAGKDILAKGAIALSQGFDQAFWREVMQSEGPNVSEHEREAMEFDCEFESQRSNNREETSTLDNNHAEVPAASNNNAFRACVAAQVCFMAKIEDSGEGWAAVARAASSVVVYLTSLQAQDFLACRTFLQEFLRSNVPIAEDDANTLLQYIGEVLISKYESERSEVAMGVSLDVMTDLAQIWAVREAGELADRGAALYSWFIDTALKKSISSPHVHICISSMLQKVLKIRPEYARDKTSQSARTSLFEVLSKGDMLVKFQIGSNIADIFGLFVLKEHDHILGDVSKTLPNDPTSIEGIALRLFVLAHLAASWSTLLRRCVYAILECPRHVPESTGHARHCFGHITTALGLAKPRDIFKLFVSQIIYTWLDTSQSLRSLPYTIFGYATLSELFHDVQDEIVGQIIMRGQDDEASQLGDDLGTTFGKLVEVSFSKATAYSISRDVAVPQPISTQAPRAETRLRNILGKEQYSSLVTQNFAEILTLFFKTMELGHDGRIEKGFRKHPESANVSSAYQEILSKAGPDKELPANQQPSFSAKYLLDEIDLLCRRTSYDAESLWSPSLYVYVYRELLNEIHPALGSLHACSILRKIRILICMARSTAFENYPLEMALHSLEPYLTDAQCAEEAIGIVQYLLEHGSSYLKEAPSFLAGHAVSTLTSMKAFFESTQDSTTQESQFKATMSRAQAFHTWLARFLGGYRSLHLAEESAKCFQRIVDAASNIQTGGNARSGTYESDLLLELLEDQRSGRDLLDQACKDSILGFLCTPFELPSDFREDILGSDEKAQRYASIIWKTCQRGVSSRNYLLWAGRVLGRAYAGKGLLDREMVYETHLNSERDTALDEANSPSASSRNSLMQLLCDLLTDRDGNKVGRAETTLRSIVTRADGTDYFLECEQWLRPSLTETLLWRQYHLPALRIGPTEGPKLQECAAFNKDLPAVEWVQQLCVALALTAANDPLLSELAQIMKSVKRLAEKAFPYILHLVLLREANGQMTTRRIMSEAFHQWFQNCTIEAKTVVHSTQMLVNAILYLRTQPLPDETTKADRARWLELDYRIAAAAAIKCSMFKSALMFLEIDNAETVKRSRRSSAVKAQDPTHLLLEIYENIDEQDSFYGVQQPSSLTSMMARLEYEHAGFKSLSFRGAYYDGQIRHASGDQYPDEESVVRALDNLDLNGLSRSLLNNITNAGPNAVDAVLRTARKLEQWDISAPVTHLSSASTIFRALQGINSSSNSIDLLSTINTGISESMNQLIFGQGAKSSMHSVLGSLAILTEADEVFSSKGSEQLYEALSRFDNRDDWMYSESFDHVKDIMSCRETLFGSLSKRPELRSLLKTSVRDARTVESRLLLNSSKMSRMHGALQNALTTATYLNQLVIPCEEAGVDISAAVRFESANVLWAQGEMTASIRMLQDLQKSSGLHAQLAHIGKPELLAKLGYQISEARLEKPDEIIHQYLTPAIKELHGKSEGDEAGQVFHEFASFCDQQLQNPDASEDFQRIQKLRERKESEMKDLDKMIKSSSSQGKDRAHLKKFRDTTKSWWDLDDQEYRRLRDARQTFLRQSLENYLLCLKACDKYDQDALRFSAMWLENYNSDIANGAVSRHLSEVGSRKFAAHMNQWSSRLLDVPGHFQELLSSLVFRICVDHPYHGMYQIFASSKTKGGKDETALARFNAANNIVAQLKANKRSEKTWYPLHNTNVLFVRFAAERLDDPSIKQGSTVPLRKFNSGQRVEHEVPKAKIPPPTARIELRPDCDYTKVPLIAKFKFDFNVASGVSMPKIVTAYGTDGLKYKQLFKSGNDDLRQDSIMEQVFEQVSNLLRTQRATRQRNLCIRTYKVLPFTATAGVIEFVPDTIPLHDYLIPAHARHFPKDLKLSGARKLINDAQNKATEHRIQQFRKVCDHFHPVLRYFFTERFENPDDWFDKRLAYTRSTAAISILGHVLGLGDRHGHNILLDEKTGEVVHIDLGIAFEQGRVLPVPEVVPFRLTRDLVDGMGITKTEGVFRRCCEFTLEALRNESYSIMTILDVLRYDPLYSWSLSPLRLKKIQDAHTEDPRVPGGEGKGDGNGGPGVREHEPGEADRALTVVAKKLSRSLSVQATVNELIQMATDERNLAVLYCGWAAYV